MHLGIFGGTFNPIHVGHLHIARYVLATCGLDRLLFIPTGDPPHKDGAELAPARHRLEMVRLALAEEPGFEISDIETRRPRPSYTVDTLTTLQAEMPEIAQWSFIIGLDAFLEFHTWKQASYLLTLCHFIVCARPGSNFSRLPRVPQFSSLPTDRLDALDTGDATHIVLPLPTNTTLTLLAPTPCDASSSDIRTAIAYGRSVSNWLPPPVESYIIHHRLYQ